MDLHGLHWIRFWIVQFVEHFQTMSLHFAVETHLSNLCTAATTFRDISNNSFNGTLPTEWKQLHNLAYM